MRSLILAFVTYIILLVFPLPVAQSSNSIDKTIEELQSKIAQLQSQESSLSKQITLLDTQIKLTQLRMEDTKRKITQLEREIGELSEEIDRLEILKTKRLELVLHRIPHTYKRSVIPQFGLLLFAQNFSEFLSRAKYLLRVQEQDTLLYKQLQLTQLNYNERKDVREKKKTEQEVLKRQFETQTAELARQKREKQVLLEQTKNSESVYQKLLAQALAEKQALEQAKREAIKVGPVKKGDPIGLVGNTGWPGCSTGPHLHLEIQKNNSWVDPARYLSPKAVLDVQDTPSGVNWTVGSGSWDWPLQDTIRLTQHFGKTPYSWQYGYSGGIHTGFDMVSASSEVIRAPSDGTLYSSSLPCGSSSIIKIKHIDHGDGVMSFYLHVQ